MGASPFLGGSFLKTLLLRVFFYSADFFFISFLLISTCFTVSYRVRLFLASSLGGLKLSSLFSPGEGAAGVVYPMLALGSGAILGGAFFFSLCFSEVVSYVFGDDFFKSALLAVPFLGGALGVYLYELSSGLG